VRINIFTSESLKRLIHSASRMGILRALYQHSSLALIRHKAGKLLNPLFPNNPVWLTIEGGILAGSDICADLRHGEKSYWLGTFEMEVQSAIQRLATQSPHLKCIYDIGAHVGYFSMMLARCFQRAHIFAFEPNPSNYERLALNIQRNRLTCEVTPVHRAVCDQVGELPFYVGESSWSGSLHREHRESSRLQYTVSTTTLDEIVFQDHYPPPDLLRGPKSKSFVAELGCSENINRRSFLRSIMRAPQRKFRPYYGKSTTPWTLLLRERTLGLPSTRDTWSRGTLDQIGAPTLPASC